METDLSIAASSPFLDTWELTEDALRAVFKLMYYQHEIKPEKNSPKREIWEREMVEARRWANSIHLRRIKLNQDLQRSQRDRKKAD